MHVYTIQTSTCQKYEGQRIIIFYQFEVCSNIGIISKLFHYVIFISFYNSLIIIKHENRLK